MDSLLADINIEDPTAVAPSDVEMADGITSTATEQVVREKKKKEKKEKKEKRETKDKKEKKRKLEDIQVEPEKKKKKKSKHE
jgi:nucleolar protein 56